MQLTKPTACFLPQPFEVSEGAFCGDRWFAAEEDPLLTLTSDAETATSGVLIPGPGWLPADPSTRLSLVATNGWFSSTFALYTALIF